MKIIKQGKLPTIQKTCGYCECVFEFDVSEVMIYTTIPSEVSCPCCKNNLKLYREEEYKLNIRRKL